MSKAYDEGYDAGFKGIRSIGQEKYRRGEFNPYEKGTKEHQDWEEGYADGEEDSEG